MEKVFRGGEFSAVGDAVRGSAGIKLVRLFQVELEHYEKQVELDHYEKMEGRPLSLEGKAE